MNIQKEEHFLIGKSKQEAIEILEGLNNNYRIITEEGKHFIYSMELNPGRLNLVIQDGLIQDISYG